VDGKSVKDPQVMLALFSRIWGHFCAYALHRRPNSSNGLLPMDSFSNPSQSIKLPYPVQGKGGQHQIA
jgi:hypothetical protein